MRGLPAAILMLHGTSDPARNTLVTLLSKLPATRLRSIAVRIGAPVQPGPAALAEGIASHLTAPGTLTGLLTTLTDPARELLALLMARGGEVPSGPVVRKYGRSVGESGRGALAELESLGIVFVGRGLGGPYSSSIFVVVPVELRPAAAPPPKAEPRRAARPVPAGMFAYLEFTVSLLDIEPPIWRQFLLHADATLYDVHCAIQDAVGWENHHLFTFREKLGSRHSIGGVPGSDEWDEPEPDARTIPIRDVFAHAGRKIFYEYDFGDGWMHSVSFKKTHLLREQLHRRLLAGDRAGPPEDCGGPWGYADCVATIERLDRLEAEDDEDDLDEEEEERLDWLGSWRPDGFELAAAQRAFDR